VHKSHIKTAQSFITVAIARLLIAQNKHFAQCEGINKDGQQVASDNFLIENE